VYSLSVFFIGCVVTVMNGLNSALSLRVGNPASLIAVHLAGLATVSLLLLARREVTPGGRLPFYYYCAGVLGVGTVLASNVCFAALGASLSVGLALFGQVTGALFVDGFGLFGMKRRGFDAAKLIGPALALVAVFVMAEGWDLGSPFMALAFGTGLLTLAGFGLNSHLAGTIGPLRATRVNYLSGLFTSAIVVALIRPSFAGLGVTLRGVSPILLLGGGALGVLVVAGMNRIFPRIPASSSTLLLFSGQVAAGLLVDLATSRALPPRRIAGAALLILALAVRTLIEAGEGSALKKKKG